jgi:hypothetical protein
MYRLNFFINQVSKTIGTLVSGFSLFRPAQRLTNRCMGARSEFVERSELSFEATATFLQ